MLNQLNSEFYRTSKSKSLFVLPVVILLFVGLGLLTINLASAKPGILSLLNVTGASIIYDSFSTAIISIIIAIFVSSSVAGSFANGSIQMSVMRGAQRVALYLSKFITAAAVTVTLTVYAFLLSIASSAIFFGGAPFSSSEFGFIIAALGLQILMALAYTALFTLVSSVIRSTSGAVAGSIILIVLTPLVIGYLINMSLETHQKWPIYLTNIFLTTQVSAISRIEQLTAWQIVCAVLVPIFYIVTTTGIGAFVFVKRDIKNSL